jgi:simple sugar transport system permease protein
VLQANGGPDAGAGAFALGAAAALAVGAGTGLAMGLVIAWSRAHPILVSLAMMIFLRGLGEYLTRGGDISGFPPMVAALGQGTLFGIPAPLLVFLLAVVLWQVFLGRTPLGFTTYMIGSNIEATRYSGIDTRRALTLIYTLSGLMAAIAGIIMLARFNSVRVGHGESYLLITVLACFLGGVDPFGGFGRVTSVALALVILQCLSSGLNLLGANQHLATAVWGLVLLGVMVLRYLSNRWLAPARPKGGRRP